MTEVEPSSGALMAERLRFVPELRDDFERRDIGGESVVWSPIAAEPIALDPTAAVMLDVIDGEASIGDLALEVHDVVAIPLETAERQVTRIVDQFWLGGLLTSSPTGSNADDAIATRELFVSAPTPCSENASRLGTVTLNLRLGAHTARIACDSRRGARLLRNAVREHVVDNVDDAPLAFVLTAPQGLKRTHRLTDRAGFVLSEGRGLPAGLHGLASHLTALLPPAPGTVRIRTRGVVAGDRTILSLFPLLYFPVVDERLLLKAGIGLIDRLAVDVRVRTGEVENPPIPWPELAVLAAGPGHVGIGKPTVPSAILIAAAARGLPPPTQSRVVAALAANGLQGSRADLLDASMRLVEHAELLSAPPQPDAFAALLVEFGEHPGT